MREELILMMTEAVTGGEVRRGAGLGDLVGRCPDCGRAEFTVEEVAGSAVFRCRGCRAGWRYALGYLQRVG